MSSSSPPSLWIAAARIIVGSLLLGGLTSFAQGVLPDSIASFANSPSGWTALTVAMIWLQRPSLLPAACLGAVSFVCLVLGYTIASELRGLSYSPLLWGAIGLVAGPAIGWSTSATWNPRPLLNAVGSSVLAGVAISDAVYGLTIVADTTSPVYWSIVGVAGVVFLALVAFRLKFAWRFVGLQVVLTLMWVGLGSAAYAVLNGMYN